VCFQTSTIDGILMRDFSARCAAVEKENTSANALRSNIPSSLLRGARAHDKCEGTRM
jgi:hypothetical protein